MLDKQFNIGNKMTEFSESKSEKVVNAWQRLQTDWPGHQGVSTKDIMHQYNKWELYDEVSKLQCRNLSNAKGERQNHQ